MGHPVFEKMQYAASLIFYRGAQQRACGFSTLPLYEVMKPPNWLKIWDTYQKHNKTENNADFFLEIALSRLLPKTNLRIIPNISERLQAQELCRKLNLTKVQP